MNMRKFLGGLLCLLAGAPWSVHAQLIISDTLTGASSSYNWQALNGACLTAGNDTGSIPACIGKLTYYTSRNSLLVGGTNGRLPDAVGSGALRLTNGDTTNGGSNGDNQTGAVVSNFTFPTNQGLQVTFTTATYGGDGNNGTGADGISFFLADGSQAPSVGGLGGSLGYSCSNVNSQYEGVVGGYLGVGIDEYGNFSNPADNTSTGPGFKAGRISLRGAGNITWASLNALDPVHYPSTLTASQQTAAVKATCQSGKVMDYSITTTTTCKNNNNCSTTTTGPTGVATTTPLPDYPLLLNGTAYSDLPSGVSISNQEGLNLPLRGNATPITYGLQITQDGLLSMSYSVNGGTAQTVVNKQSITDSNGPLPASFRFGFSGGTGGSSNVHEITCFKAGPANQSSSSAGTNLQQSARVEAGAQVYLAYYHPTNSWGEMTAQDLVSDPTTGIVSINPVANWDASCVLTGGSCQATNNTNTAQGSSSRNMLTWNGTAGIPFQWSQLTTAQKTALTAGDASQTDIRLRYLRGDRSNELTNTGGTLRARSGMLGDIIDSSPTWVGPPSLPNNGPWQDALFPASTAPEAAGSYAAFAGTTAATAQGGRQNVVYIGANDGFLHGFRSGTYDANGNFVNTTNDGNEVVAYIPAAILNLIHSTTPALDFSSTQYSHDLYTDATPGTGDLYYSGAWHTWLVGGVGPGGNATGPIGDQTSIANGVIYALDVTDPTQFSEANASSLVRGEWTSGTGAGAITCVGNATCGNNLGSTYGTPIIRRLHNGQWAALFGNGLNSSTGTAGLFIMLVDPATGAITFRFIDTGAGPAKSGSTITARNGMAYVASADLDGDHVTDYVYGGDALGNVWRFDLTSSNPASWAASAAPIFKTAAGQPITTRVTVSSIQGIGPSGQSGVVVSFGTGRQFPQTQTSAATYATGAQALYGVWDWNMSAWNAKAGASAQYASLSAPQTVNSTTLQTQSITATAPGSGSISGYRTLSNNKVCWKGSSSCSGGASANTQFGWTLPLPSTGNEQVIYSPTTAYSMFLVNTTIPAVSQALTCGTQPASGYTMAVSLDSGGAPKASFFGDQNGNFVTYNGGIVSGIGLSATGTPSIVTANKWPNLVQQTTDGTGVVTKINPAANGKGGRLTWIRLR
ncbi:PilC/PilY family type IV pilus protein [Variovorax sp. RT4R15]|uniref:PilC/PilY family type IV pilus protein n=1 Tax=Variovorax sp. RT4R15 TaxID=3443737 RepID=UPI003F47CC14